MMPGMTARAAARALLSLLSLGVMLCGCVEDVPPDGAWPDRYEPVRGEAPLGYITNNGSDDVSVIALGSMTEVARVSVGTSPVDPEAPHHLAIDPVGKWIYVGLSNVGLVEGGGLHGGHGGGALPGYV